MSRDLAVIVEMTRKRVQYLLSVMCTDPANRNYGGFFTENATYADSRNAILEAGDLFAAYLYADFPHYHARPEVLERLRMHLEFMKRRQRPDGTICLWSGGAGSGNEVGFTLPGVVETYKRVQACALPGRDEILPVLEQYIQRGASAVRSLFPHTSNHRWTACIGPLSAVESVFPDPRNCAVIDEYLSDGIDMDADGLYYEERSPGYSMVANHGLIYLADYYGRRDLLDLAACNCRMQLHLIQPSGECETLFSHRQDRGAAGGRWGDYYVFKRLAVETGDGQLARAADLLLGRLAQQGLFWSFIPLRYRFDDARLAEERIVRRSLPTHFERVFRENPIWRYRNDGAAMTVVADKGGHWFDITQGEWGGRVRSSAVMSYHVGAAVIDMIQICWGVGVGTFRPEQIEHLGPRHVRMQYRDPGWPHLAHYRPTDKQGPRMVEVDMAATMEVRADEDGGAEIDIDVTGWGELPVNIQLLLRHTCSLTLPCGSTQALDRGGLTFTAGEGRYVLSGPDGAQVVIHGLPPSQAHLSVGERRTITGQAEQRCHRLVANLFTPARLRLRFEPVRRPPDA